MTPIGWEIAVVVDLPSPSRDGWVRSHAFNQDGGLVGVDDTAPDGRVVEVYNLVEGWREIDDGGVSYRRYVLAERDRKKEKKL